MQRLAGCAIVCFMTYVLSLDRVYGGLRTSGGAKFHEQIVVECENKDARGLVTYHPVFHWGVGWPRDFANGDVSVDRGFSTREAAYAEVEKTRAERLSRGYQKMPGIAAFTVFPRSVVTAFADRYMAGDTSGIAVGGLPIADVVDVSDLTGTLWGIEQALERKAARRAELREREAALMNELMTVRDEANKLAHEIEAGREELATERKGLFR